MRLKIKTNNQTETNADDDIYPYHLIDTDAAVLKSWGCFETMMDAKIAKKQIERAYSEGRKTIQSQIKRVLNL